MNIDTDRGTIALPFREDLGNLFPQAPRINGHIVLPHRPDTMVLMRNLGIHVPSPVLHHYDFPHPVDKPPFAVQRETVQMLTENTRAYVLSSMGVGKTVCPLWAFDYLKGLGMAKSMVVFAPLSSLNFTWAAHLFEFFPHLTYRVVYGDREKRLRLLADIVDVYIVNHDGWLVIGKELMERKDIDVLVIDELAVYRNSNATTKWMQKFAPDQDLGVGHDRQSDAALADRCVDAGTDHHPVDRAQVFFPLPRAADVPGQPVQVGAPCQRRQARLRGAPAQREVSP